MTGYEYLNLLLFQSEDDSQISLRYLSGEHKLQTGKKISKEGLNKKFGSQSVSFIKLVLERSIKISNTGDNIFRFLGKFGTCRIKDSTSFQVPEHLADKYPGSGGAASKAMMRIQFEYDLLTSKILDLSLHPFNEQDQKNSKETKLDIRKNDLIIRDLGYVNIDVIRHTDEVKAFYISRLPHKLKVYELRKDEYLEISFNELYKYLKKNNLSITEKLVYISKIKNKTRLIVERLPDKVYEERLKKAEEDARKRKYALTDEYKARLRLNIFITNIYADEHPEMSPDIIHKFYTLRWQIELMFKAFKSIVKIHRNKKVKVERLETQLYVRLVYIVINWDILWNLSRIKYREDKKLLSIYKLFDRIKKSIMRIQVELKTPTEYSEYIETLLTVMIENDLLEYGELKNSLYDILKLIMA